MSSGTHLYDSDADVLITTYINAVIPDQELVKITHQTLDGRYYVQILGDASSFINFDVYVDDTGKDAVLTANANGDLLYAICERGNYQGRILEVGSWEEVGQTYYKTTIKMGMV